MIIHRPPFCCTQHEEWIAEKSAEGQIKGMSPEERAKRLINYHQWLHSCYMLQQQDSEFMQQLLTCKTSAEKVEVLTKRHQYIHEHQLRQTANQPDKCHQSQHQQQDVQKTKTSSKPTKKQTQNSGVSGMAWILIIIG